MISLVSDTIDRNDIDSLISWLSRDTIPRLTKGELTIQLEDKWAKKLGTKYSVYVNSGSSSILLTLAALKYSNKLRNTKIVIPGLSWATDLSSPLLLGYDVHLCDCNLHDLSCDLDHLEKIFKEENPSVLVLVSVLGLVPDMKRVVDLCNKYNVILLEDVCESMGSKFNNVNLGTFGFASFFSTYFGHHLSTIEGGFINTNDEDFYHLLLMMRSHGWDRDLPSFKKDELRLQNNVDAFRTMYTFYVPGFNLRSTDLQAYIGLLALDKLENYSEKRNKNYILYRNKIINTELLIKEDGNNFISNFAYPLVCKDRDRIVTEFMNNQIEIRPLIAGDLSKHPMWLNTHNPIKLKNCELIDTYGFYIPNHQDLTISDIDKMCNIINNI